ncbi:MAG: S8 family serine peptidase [Myxococcota bacterium]
MARVSIAWIALALASACGGGGGGGGGGASGPPYTITGSMPAAVSTQVDSDTNNPSAPFTANDSSVTAQEISNPVTLGGHVNVAGAKPFGVPDGRTTVAGDAADWFRVSLAAGQTVRLQIAEDGNTNNVDLELRMLDTTLVASSTSTGRSEEITVMTTGDYYVVVVATAGFSNYTLTIGQTGMRADGPAPLMDFVPGEIIVRYHDGPSHPMNVMSAQAAAGRFAMDYMAGDADGPMLYSCKDPNDRALAFSALGISDDAPTRSIVAADPEARLREDTQKMVEALRAQPDVQSADLNYIRQPSAVPTDEFFPLQWHYQQVNLPTAWDGVSDNNGVIVAVIDTGVRTAHPDLAGQLVGGYDFIQSTAISNDGDGCDGNPDDPGDLAAGGSSFHGTHVAGTVVARTSLQGGGDANGVAGVAWNAEVMPLRVLGVGGGTDFDIMAAMRYAAGLDNACSVTPPATAQILNLSLGGPGFNQTFQDLVTTLRNDHDMVIVAAAGNDASSAPIYPAAYAGVISVSAVGPTQLLAPYSNFGATIDIAAPGGDFTRDTDGDGFPDGVLSTLFDVANNDFVYAFYQGTSMATPHVAGILALMLGVNPALTPVDIDNAINLGEITEDIGSPNFFGAGLIDAVKAVNKAAEGGGGGGVLAPVLRIEPDALNYGFLANSFTVTARNGGNAMAALNLMAPTFMSDDGMPWLTITPATVGADGLGDYTATIDRSGLADGLYTGTITFDSDSNDVMVPVIMQVGDATAAQSNAGHHFVLLVEPGTLATVDFVEVDPVSGSYSFAFGNVQPGQYMLIAGTDSDNDFVVCDEGEACGAYPTLETIVEIDVQSNLGLQFLTGFTSTVGTAGVGGTGRVGFSREVGGRVAPPVPAP